MHEQNDPTTAPPFDPDMSTLQPGEIRASYALQSALLGDYMNRDGSGRCPGSGHAFAFKAPKMGTRKELGALKGRKELQQHPGKHTVAWLAVALREWRGQPAGKEADLAVELAALPAGDILFLLFAWQFYARPNGLPLSQDQCHTCGKEFGAVSVDLTSLQLLVPPPDAPPACAVVGLLYGFELDGQEVKALRVEPPTWAGSFLRVHASSLANDDLTRAMTLQDTIREIEGSKRVQVPMSAIDELWPEDVELIDTAAGMVTAGPVLVVELECPSCGHGQRTKLDWRGGDPLAVGHSRH